MEIPEELRQHATTVRIGRTIHLKCTRCGRLFFSVRDLAAHIEAQHGKYAYRRGPRQDTSQNIF